MIRSLVALLCAVALPHVATAADIRLLTTGAFKPIAQDIIPTFEKETGHRVLMQNDTAGALIRKINEGAEFDVIVLTLDGLEKFYGEKKIMDDTVAPLMQVGIGMAARMGSPRPNIANIESFRKTLLAAKAVAYVNPASGGTSGIYLEGLFNRLGILPQIRAKRVLVTGGLAAQRVASNDADIALQQWSEIKLVSGVQHVGLIPTPIQLFTIYAGAVGYKARDKDAAMGLISAFSDPGNEPLFKKRGVELP